MTLGTGILASVFSSTVLVLAVYHRQFRKVFFWFAGISAIAAAIFFLGLRLYRKHETKQRAEAEQRIQACVARFPIPYVLEGQRMSAFAIASACARNPDFTLGDCTNNGCVVYRGKKIMGGISHNEITNAQWHTCENKSAN